MQEQPVAQAERSHTTYRMDLLPSKAILTVGSVLAKEAETYGDRAWMNDTQAIHLDHAITHLMLHIKGDTSEHHLANAACRILFALDLLA